MWSPTHVHVIVRKAEGLLAKGKNGTNNAFIVIELGKETYRTSVKEKSGSLVDWNEECELKIPKIGNSACLVLTALHRNNLGLDQFLGTVRIPLSSFDKFQRITEWYKLEGKPGKDKGKDKYRGELQVELGFVSKVQSQSLTSLNLKKKKSLERITGSLFGLSDKKIGVKKFTGTLGRFASKKKRKNSENDEVSENDVNVNNYTTRNSYNNLDPGVISEDEDCASHKSSESLSNITENQIAPPLKPRRIFTKNPQISVSHWEEEKPYLSSSLNVSEESVSSGASRKPTPKLGDLKNRLKEDRRLSSSCVDFSLLTSPKPEKKFSSSLYLETTSGESQKKLSKFARKLRNFHTLDKREIRRSVVDGCEASANSAEDLTTAIKSEFKHKNKDELIKMVVDLQKRVNCISVRVKDLEDYLDGILLKVMETVPKILEKS